MGKTQAGEPELAQEQSRQSVDLDRFGIPMDEFLRDHGDIAADDGSAVVTVNHGRSAAQEMLTALAALAERSPRAVVVLLLSAVRGKSNREISKIMRIQRVCIERSRALLRRDYAALAACCTRR
jgi:DNA-directed RNA polymerase specialized sigma24 family protein